MSQEYDFIFVGVEQKPSVILKLVITTLEKIGYGYYSDLGYFDLKKGDLIRGTFKQAQKSVLSNEGGAINFIKRDKKLGSFGFINLNIFLAFDEKWISVTFDSTYTRLPDYEKNKNAIREVILALKSVVQCEKIVEGYIGTANEYLPEKSLKYLENEK